MKVRDQDGAGVGADSEESGITEIQKTGQTDHNIQSQPKDQVGRDPGCDPDQVGVAAQRNQHRH